MNTLKYIIAFLIVSIVSAQESEVSLFDKNLNQFLNVRDFCMSNSGDEAYFSVQSVNQDVSQVVFIKKEGNIWSKPKIPSFCNEFMYLEPFLTSDGNKLFFVSNRPLDHTSKTKKDFDIWYVTRVNKNSPWSQPINLGNPVNTELDEFYPTLSMNNNLYFTLDSPNGLGKDDIYVSTWNGKNYSKPELLNENINSNGYEFNAFISEDESFLLYTKYGTKDGYGSGDLYKATKDENGNWQKSKNLGKDINSKYMEYCPFYNEKEQTLYFTSRRNSLKPKSFDSIEDFMNYTSNGENGLSKIYKVKIDLGN